MSIYNSIFPANWYDGEHVYIILSDTQYHPSTFRSPPSHHAQVYVGHTVLTQDKVDASWKQSGMPPSHHHCFFQCAAACCTSRYAWLMRRGLPL